MEDQVLAGTDQPLVIACFQRERFYRQEAQRYVRIARRTPQVYVLAAPESEFKHGSGAYETIAFSSEDGLSQEWHLVVIGEQYSLCLVCREHEQSTSSSQQQRLHMDQARRFEGIWTFDRQASYEAAKLLLARIRRYRPELRAKTQQALANIDPGVASGFHQVDPAPFADRLVTYLQAGQYRQQKAYRQIASQERKERLVNSITAAIRRSLNSDQVLRVAVQELGQSLHSQRCVIYRCQDSDETAQIQYEFIRPGQVSLLGQVWPLRLNPWFQIAIQTQEWICVEEVIPELQLQSHQQLLQPMTAAQIRSLLMVPVLYQGHLLGIVELHQTEGEAASVWGDSEISLVEAIATQVGIALIQAQSFADLEDLNQQLEALEQARSNLIAITGHELRTPLSTVQVCLESLANEPDMPAELRQVMLDTALTDAERMRELIQDFLVLSRLESGRVEWNPEPLSLQECIDLALSSTRTRKSENLPLIAVDYPANLPMLQADGEWLVEVLTKLLDNACKFTNRDGTITIQATVNTNQMVEVTIADTGRGIEPDRLETVFERFYQEEGALRRTTGGTGLGLAICRQIIQNFGGTIWAESKGKDQGSTFRFTVPSVASQPPIEKQQRSRQPKSTTTPSKSAKARSKQ